MTWKELVNKIHEIPTEIFENDEASVDNGREESMIIDVKIEAYPDGVRIMVD